MRLTAKVKLRPTPEQRGALLETLQTANRACNEISKLAWDNQQFKQFPLHRLAYRMIRSRFNLTAQMAVRCVAKVADAYKAGKHKQRTFNLRGSIPYDNRILSWMLDRQEVSIWTTGGREHIPFVCGEHHLRLLQSQRGESDLCLIGGEFYLFTTCDVETPPPAEVEWFLGVDLGIQNIATDSDGDRFAGGHVNGLRKRHAKLRSKLQSTGTESAHKVMKKRRCKEARFAKDVNHCIAKRVVEKAKDTGRGIALEQLKGIRERVTVRRSQRRQHHAWSFYDLQQKIVYKAQIAGIPVVFVDPKNTSRQCPACGHASKSNRQSQAAFLCVECGFSGHADHIAARNIAGRVAVNQPNVGIAIPHCDHLQACPVHGAGR